VSPSQKKARKPRAAPKVIDLSSRAHRQLIGSIGFWLPLLLWLIAGWRPTPPLPQWTPLTSVSAYYYTGAASFFAGALIALALFLFSYQGYDNSYGRRDRIAAFIAGGAAVLVVYFPTDTPDPAVGFSWWMPYMGTIHALSAAVLFSSFIFFALFQFPRSNSERADQPTEKRIRNGIYLACGLVMVICTVWAFTAGIRRAPVFLPEVIALEAFAVSWLVKGRADETAAAAGRKAVHYARHPRKLADDALKQIRGR
jgi:hypothetical protein